MPDAMMYHEDNYVVLPPNMVEQFVNQAELEQLLKNLLSQIQDNLPTDLQTIPNIDDQVQRLIKTTCELEYGNEGKWQWYVVRLEKK